MLGAAFCNMPPSLTLKYSFLLMPLRKKMTFLDKRRRAKEQILSATSLLYVPLSGPQYQIAFTLLCIRFPLSACLHTLITQKKDTNICLNRHAGNRFKMEPMYPRGPLTGESADTQQCQLCQNTRGGGGGGGGGRWGHD